MGVLALILGIVAVLLALLPTFGFTQILGVALGAMAFILSAMARGRAKEAGKGRGLARAGMAVAITAIVISGAVFTTCQIVTHEMGQKLGNEMKRELPQGETKPGREPNTNRNVSDPKSK